MTTYSAGLRGGSWVQRKGIRTWAADPHPPVDEDAARCGTDSGYYRHRRVTDTDPCGPCKAAHATAEATRQEHHRAAERAALLATLTAERNDARWWATPTREPDAESIARANGDDELTTARRRRVLDVAMTAFETATREGEAIA